MSDNEHIQDLVLVKCQSLYWKKRTVYVERKNCASLKNLRENLYKTLWLPLNWALIYWRKIFLLTTSFHSYPLFFSSSLTWFSPYFIYLSATPYSTATTATTNKAIGYHIQLLCSICSHVRSIFWLQDHPSPTTKKYYPVSHPFS